MFSCMFCSCMKKEVNWEVTIFWFNKPKTSKFTHTILLLSDAAWVTNFIRLRELEQCLEHSPMNSI
jgi:hypothetical protein